MTEVKLNKLTDEVVRQIAAGEVIERPASVVKELIDNSIDAGASRISLKIRNGGIDLIEVSDNGIGIPRENLASVFEAHTTSKLKSIEDLNNLLSMGFRGEALSTITSVAIVTTESRFSSEDTGSKIEFTEKGNFEMTTIAKENGTTVKVENLFYNIPARRKYLKTSSTEYRKIYELFIKYILIYPNISFVLEKDGKNVLNLKAVSNSKPGEILEDRALYVLGKDFKSEMLAIFYKGNGISLSGYISHPGQHKNKAKAQFVYLNNRAIYDRGIVRAVMEGYSRYIPFKQKVDFVLNIKLKPELVDINVHPRKEEVRFENPFRVYSAIEEAVKHTLEKNLSFRTESGTFTPDSSVSTDFKSIRENYNRENHSKPQSIEYEKSDGLFDNKSTAVRDSIIFSKELFSEIPSTDINSKEFPLKNEDIKSINQVFNKYIVVEYSNDLLWIVDQHAAAERINFEKLQNREQNNQNLQNLLIPEKISFSPSQLLLLDEHKEFFSQLGFIYLVHEDNISLKTVPAEYSESDYKQIFLDIFELEEDISNLKRNFVKRKEDILATISCHGSVRAGQRLMRDEMIDVIRSLKACKNPYSCPHGRPIVWVLKLSEIDSHFERTY